MQIGELFILRINIHLQGSVLDAPELMWAEPQLEPVYQAVRSYLEMDQRVGLLTERLDVIADLLQVLKDQLTHTHGMSQLYFCKTISNDQLTTYRRVSRMDRYCSHRRRNCRRCHQYPSRLVRRRGLERAKAVAVSRWPRMLSLAREVCSKAVV
jgi:hypothetical protein